MTKILITGGAGNVGSALAHKLVANPNYFVVVVDNLLTGSLEKLPARELPNFSFIKADVNEFNELSAIMLSYHFDFVFHYAAMVGVKRTLAHPLGVMKDIEGIKHILSLSKNTGVKRVFYSSSSEVYGEPVEFPQNEHTTPLNSKLPYAIVKNVGEAFFRSYYKEYGLEYTIFRFFNTYGPQQSADFVIMKFIQAALSGTNITIYGDGAQTRTFCYIDDNIDATTHIFEKILFLNDVANIGSALEMSVLDLARLVIKITNSTSKIIHVDALPEGDMTRRQPDTAKMKMVLQRELISVEEGIKRILTQKFGVNINNLLVQASKN
jgi:nucleoside-diphosphate-sugar epimerase